MLRLTVHDYKVLIFLKTWPLSTTQCVVTSQDTLSSKGIRPLSSYRLLECLIVINNTPTYTWAKYLYVYICTQRELCMALAYTEWKKAITMNTDACVAFSSNAEKNDVRLCVF